MRKTMLAALLVTAASVLTVPAFAQDAAASKTEASATTAGSAATSAAKSTDQAATKTSETAHKAAKHHTANQGNPTGQDGRKHASCRTGGRMARAEFVGLDLALLILDQHADRAELNLLARLVPLLDRLDRSIGGGLIGIEGEHQLFLSHVSFSS